MHAPEGVNIEGLYRPVDRGFERTLAERLRWLEQRRKALRKGAREDDPS